MILVSLILLTFCHLEFFLVLICLCILCHYICSYEGGKFAIKNLYLVLEIMQLHGPSMFAVKAKIYGVLYNQASSVAFDETSSYWSVLKSS